MRKMRGLLLAIPLLTGLLAGCVGNRELLTTPLAQDYYLPNPLDKVWNAAILEASKPNHRILVRDEAAHLLSWLSEIELEGGLHSSLTDPEIASAGSDVTAIAVLRVEAVPGGSKLIPRLTYLSARGFYGVSASRGTYEQEILRAIRASLIAEGTRHDRN